MKDHGEDRECDGNATRNDGDDVEYSSFDTLDDAERYLLEGGGGMVVEKATTENEDGRTRPAGRTMADATSGVREGGGGAASTTMTITPDSYGNVNDDAATAANANNDNGAMMTNNISKDGHLGEENERRLRRRAEELAAFACAVMSRVGGGSAVVGDVGGIVGGGLGGGGGGFDSAHAAAVYRYWSDAMAAAEAMSDANANAGAFVRRHHWNDAYATKLTTMNGNVDANAATTMEVMDGSQFPLWRQAQLPPTRGGGTSGIDETVVGSGDGVLDSGKEKKNRKRKSRAHDEHEGSLDSIVVEGSADPPPSPPPKTKSKKRAEYEPIWCELFSRARLYCQYFFFIMSI